jgi:hypothetical protein
LRHPGRGSDPSQWRGAGLPTRPAQSESARPATATLTAYQLQRHLIRTLAALAAAVASRVGTMSSALARRHYEGDHFERWLCIDIRAWPLPAKPQWGSQWCRELLITARGAVWSSLQRSAFSNGGVQNRPFRPFAKNAGPSGPSARPYNAK